jgi:hypothetical protein
VEYGVYSSLFHGGLISAQDVARILETGINALPEETFHATAVLKSRLFSLGVCTTTHSSSSTWRTIVTMDFWDIFRREFALVLRLLYTLLTGKN